VIPSETEAQVAHQRWIVRLAGIMALAFVPATAYAGAGGTPTAPGAGRSTDYCCAALNRVTEGQGSKANTFINGTTCVAIAEDDFSRNACTGTVVKCRGEFFTPATGVVQRCFTP
jgi:hypothetical protein